MKIVSFLFLFFIPIVASAQIITTVAGNGTATFTGDGGPASSAGIYNASSIAFDSQGNLYVGLGTFNRIRIINTAGIISTYASSATSGYSGDGGPVTAAQFNGISSLTIDAYDNLYIGDGNHCIRKVYNVTGIITTVAGTGVGGYTTDGIPATSSQLNAPADVLLDKKGNIYIADYANRRVRMVDTFGIITTIAGIGIVTYGYGGDGGPADTTAIAPPTGLCMDDTGNLYIADWSSRILKVDTFGIISTYAGNGISGSGGDGGPASAANITPFKITMDVQNNLYISEGIPGGGVGPHKIRKVSTSGIITTVAGTEFWGFSGDGGPATAAQLHKPRGIALDTCDNIYICDAWNNRVRKVLFYPDCPDTTEGGTDTTLNSTSLLPKSNISIFPNPVLEELHINGVAESATYSIADIAGKQLQYGTLKMGNNSVLLVNFSPGIYLVTITEADGRVMVNKIHKE
jgi:trimeric autotransporter adhesin